ncbi:dihydroxy-acid dehydratase domain-containing protein [Micromonospora viridifaciens]|uniref:dihydroxy-acid dehydratase domain-containing protein n=1 Tax=Micromonospora viridifaciens TaxID=1881 RepID=UPI000B5AF714|nr:dihydroxy-acid dehydratase [Micromonospora viridifaciens]
MTVDGRILADNLDDALVLDDVIPRHRLQAGVTDLLRAPGSDTSGTSYGPHLLHVAPEAAVGGPPALVRDGDEIVLGIDERRLDLLVASEQLDRRHVQWTAPQPTLRRSLGALVQESITQAHQGGAFTFFTGPRGVVEPAIH